MKSIVITGAMLALAAGHALAQVRTLATYDTDKDGSISRAEAAVDPALSAQFRQLDTNFNNALESGEFARFESSTSAPQPTLTPGAPPSGATSAPTGSTPAPSGSSSAPTGSTPAPSGSTTPPR